MVGAYQSAFFAPKQFQFWRHRIGIFPIDKSVGNINARQQRSQTPRFS